MSLNDTPSGERLHIALFGRRNAGKSSLVNAITSQAMAAMMNWKPRDLASMNRGTATCGIFKVKKLKG